MEPINKKVHIALAYRFGKKEPLYLDDWNQLNELIAPLNGAKLSLPHVYLFESMVRYYPFRPTNLDCRVYDFWYQR